MKIISLFKEVRCLIQLSVRIDIELRLPCIDVKQRLKDAVSIYQQSCKEISQNSSKTVSGFGIFCFFIFNFVQFGAMIV